MTPVQDELKQRIRQLEKDLETAREEMERKVQFRWARGRVQFEKSVLAEQRKLRSSLVRYLLDSSFLVILTAPVIYCGVVPFLLLDLFMSVYQAICFPVYGIPKVRRADYLVFDRSLLQYLNIVERINCSYCSYGNGLLALLSKLARGPKTVLENKGRADAYALYWESRLGCTQAAGVRRCCPGKG